MKSTIASLQTITLPFGAGTGQRIVLDGVNGEIRIYDSSNNLLIKISPAGIFVYDASGHIRLQMATPGSTDPYSLIELFTARTDELLRGSISLADDGNRNRLLISPGENDAANGTLQLAIYPESADGTLESLFQVIGPTIAGTSARPVIDLTGASVNVNRKPNVIVDRLFNGSSNNYGQTPNRGYYVSRGAVAFGQNISDVTLSTTAGVYTEVVSTSDYVVEGDRRYIIHFSGGRDLVTGGSGFTTADTWAYKFQRSTTSGATWGDISGDRFIARAWVATGFRYNIPPCGDVYDPNISATVRWRLVATKLSGAGTVTSVMETFAGATPFEISVEDIGSQVP